MKARFFFLGLCALALAACSIDEVSQVNDTNAVTFNTRVATRATATTTNTIMDFSVWAWNGEIEFMDDVVATRSGSSSTFTTSPLYFWPTGTVDFYALSPSTTVTAVENGKEYAYIGGTLNTEGDDWTYTGNVAKAKISNGEISLDVAVPGSASEQLDLCYGVAKGYSSGSVPMNFRHALSQVVFKAKDVNPDFVVDIAGISVCSVNRGGTYTLPTSNTTTNLGTTTVGTSEISGSQGTWEVDYESQTRFEAGITAQTLPTDETVVDLTTTNGALMLIPQEVDAWDVVADYNDTALGSYIVVLCHVTENGSTLWPNGNEEQYADAENKNIYDIDGVEYAYIAMPVDVAWEEGYRYTYTIVFGEGLGYYPPDDPNFDLEGTPVLVPITFTVTVDEFQDVDAVEVPTDTDLSTITVTTAAELVGAARMGYQEINVESDITLTTYVEFTQDCVLNIAENATITAPNSTSKGDDAYILGTTNCYSAAIYVTGGTLTINGGTVATTGGSESMYTEGIWVAGGTVIINSGTFKGGNWNDETAGSESAVYVDPGAAYIYGGTFTSGNFRDGEHWAINCGNSSYKEGKAMIYCYGGTYTDGFDPADPQTDDAPSYVAEGYWSVESDEPDDSGRYTYTVLSTKVTSYNDLIDLMWSGCPEITITEDMEITSELDFTYDCDLTIASGVTISVPSGSACYNSVSSIIKVWYGKTVNIYAEGATFATLGGDESVDVSAIWVVGGSTVNVYGGTYKGGTWTDPEGKSTQGSSSATVYAEKGFVNIYDGTFLGGYSTGMGQTSILNCSGSNYSEYANIVCYGGTYQNFNPANNKSEGAGTNFCASGYTTTSETDTDGLTWYTVVAE